MDSIKAATAVKVPAPPPSQLKTTASRTPGSLSLFDPSEGGQMKLANEATQMADEAARRADDAEKSPIHSSGTNLRDIDSAGG